jgi:hypothetical protein
MKDGFEEDFVLYALQKKHEQDFEYRKIQCLLQEICTNLCERNCKVVYKLQGI